jgi:hypothetical protein
MEMKVDYRWMRRRQQLLYASQPGISLRNRLCRPVHSAAPCCSITKKEAQKPPKLCTVIYIDGRDVWSGEVDNTSHTIAPTHQTEARMLPLLPVSSLRMSLSVDISKQREAADEPGIDRHLR